MIKKFETKLPVSMYVQAIALILTTLLLIKLVLLISDSSVFLAIFLLGILYNVVIIFVLFKRILRKNNDLEITPNIIKINQIEVPIQEIEKIIIQGYFVQSVGIKQYKRKLVSIDFHFRFKNNEEVHIEELKQWASMNGIKVISGRIKYGYRN